MGKIINLKNQRFGFWTVLEYTKKNDKGQTQWLCKCDCGVTKNVTANSLRTGNSTSCGCNNTPDLSNNKFGRLQVLKQDVSKIKGRRFWICKCDCGKIITASTYNLRNNKVSSCGCDTKTVNVSAEIVDNTNILAIQLQMYKDNIEQIQKNCLLAQENHKKICENYKIMCDKINSLSKLFVE